VSKSTLKLHTLVLVLSLTGFELVAGLTQIAAVPSTPFSIALRACTAIASIVIIYFNWRTLQSVARTSLIMLAGFWLLYFMRIFFDLTVKPEQVSHQWWVYVAWAVGACSLPMLALSTAAASATDGLRVHRRVVQAVTVAAVVAAVWGSTSEINAFAVEENTGRFQLTSLNPILLGHLGVTLLVLCLWGLLYGSVAQVLTSRLPYFLGTVLGAGLIIASNSRGPLVSAVACFAFILLHATTRIKLYAAVVVYLFATLFIPFTQILEEQYGISTYDRLFGQSQLEEVNTLDRLERYKGAIADFLSYPVTGSGLEESSIGGYPHNIFLEAFMATGLLGGLLMLGGVSFALIRAIRIYRSAPEWGWISLLFVQHLVSSQFSGGIYTVNYLWALCGFVYSIRQEKETEATVSIAHKIRIY
jgi:O-antigen ligase